MDYFLNLVGGDAALEWAGELVKSQLFLFTVAFFVAERRHRKEVSKQFGLLRDVINHAADTMGRRMDGLDARVSQLEGQDESP